MWSNHQSWFQPPHLPFTCMNHYLCHLHLTCMNLCIFDATNLLTLWPYSKFLHQTLKSCLPGPPAYLPWLCLALWTYPKDSYQVLEWKGLWQRCEVCGEKTCRRVREYYQKCICKAVSRITRGQVRACVRREQPLGVKRTVWAMPWVSEMPWGVGA